MKPYVICHMLMSIDGKVTGKFLSEESIATSIERYYEIILKKLLFFQAGKRPFVYITFQRTFL